MAKLQFKQGPRHKFRDQEFWAEGGLICIENQSSGDFKVITRAEAAARAIGLNGELQHMYYADERDELCKCVVNLCEAIKEGKRQGDPSDPEVRKHLIKDRKKISVLMSTGPSSIDVLRRNNLPSISGIGTPIGQLSTTISDRFKKLEI